MSRVLKFRAWDKENEEYRNGYDVLLKYDGSAISRYALGALDTDMPVNVIIEQYTGLKDKNGKEIYEGDRIKIEGSDSVYTVEYGRGVWVARFGDESGDNICLFHYVQKNMVLYAEVIGNIHEPPKDFRPEHLKRMGVSISKGGEE